MHTDVFDACCCISAQVYEAITINCFLQIMLAWVGRPAIVSILSEKDMRTVYCIPMPKKAAAEEKKCVRRCIKCSSKVNFKCCR